MFLTKLKQSLKLGLQYVFRSFDILVLSDCQDFRARTINMICLVYLKQLRQCIGFDLLDHSNLKQQHI